MVITKQELVLESREKIKHTIVSFYEVLQAGKRLEGSFYDPEAKKVRELIQKCKLKKKILFDSEKGFVNNAFYANRFKRIFIDNGEPIYQPSDILFFKPKSPKFISKKTNIDFDLITLKENTIVLTRSGSVGNCSIVTKTLKEKLFSDDLIRITLSDQNYLGYLYAFMKTYMGKKLITTHSYGSVIRHLEPEHLMTIHVPIPKPKILDLINKKILKTFRLRDEANDLLDQADSSLHEKLQLPTMNARLMANLQLRIELEKSLKK